jgi:phosphate transport system protein
MGRESFQSKLDSLRNGVLELGEMVVSRLRSSVTALERQDYQLAEYVLENDHEINELYLDLESYCIDLFALEQPVATDLRFVAASFKIITDLERIADLAANLGGYVLSTTEELVPRQNLVDIGERAIEMIEKALEAYAQEDIARCEMVDERDDEIDGLCERAAELLLRDLLDREATGPELENLLTDAHQLLLTVRDLERVADHAVNVAARTYYVIESDDKLLY